MSAIAKIVEEQHALKTVKMLLDDNMEQLEQDIHQKQAQLKEMKAMNKMIHDNSDSPITKLKDIDAVLKSNQDFPFLTYKQLVLQQGQRYLNGWHIIKVTNIKKYGHQC